MTGPARGPVCSAFMTRLSGERVDCAKVAYHVDRQASGSGETDDYWHEGLATFLKRSGPYLDVYRWPVGGEKAADAPAARRRLRDVLGLVHRS